MASARIWEWLGRAANIAQLSDWLPRWARDLVWFAVMSAAVAVFRWLSTFVGDVDPFSRWVGSALFVAALIWAFIGLRMLAAGSRQSEIPMTATSHPAKSSVEYMGLAMNSGTAIFRVGTSTLLREADFDAYVYFVERNKQQQQRIIDFIARDPRRNTPRYTKRDFIALVDKKLALKLRFNDLIDKGNRLETDLLPPRLPLPGQEDQVIAWESEALRCLEEEMPDRVGEFQRDIGPIVGDVPALVHRVRTRNDRLVKFKETI